MVSFGERNTNTACFQQQNEHGGFCFQVLKFGDHLLPLFPRGAARQVVGIVVGMTQILF
jgi:hypothetical protein